MNKLLLMDFIEGFESIDRNQMFIDSEFFGLPRQIIKLMETTPKDNIPKVCLLYLAL